MSFITDLQDYATAAATRLGIPPSLFLWQIGQESSWNPNASNAGHVGLGQFDAPTAAQFGLTDRTNPYASIDAAAQYDAQLYGTYGNWTDALTHYGTIGPNVPQSVNDAAAQVIGADPQSAAGMNFFSGTLNGIENLFGFGPGVPQVSGSDITAANRDALAAGIPTTANNMRGALGDWSQLETWFSSWATRGVVVVLALIFIAGGIYLFGTGRQIAVLKK